MSDRKYRQHGYQDSGQSKSSPSTPKPRPQDMTFGPRPLNMPGARTVSRCAMCGTILPPSVEDSKCPKCGLDLHSCKMCNHFDPGSRFECQQPITERVSPKDTRNLCSMYSIRQAVERETSSSPAPGRSNDARKAFDDLFKKL
jgi:predicted RNA-binding Zn-ribbon protein involved in translation (DUF1610 family)